MDAEALKSNKEIIDSVELVLQAIYESASDFNRALDGDSPINIPSLRNKSDYQIEASEILFWTDRDAYNDELSSWQPKRNLENHAAAIAQIKANDLVPVVHELAGAIRKNRVAPFIGAGISQPCNYPGWGAALEVISQKIAGLDAAAFKAKMDAYDYLGAAQVLWDKDDAQVRSFIQTKFSDGTIPPGGIQGPIKLLPRFSRGCIITTNFDHLIERTFEPVQFEGYMHGRQAGNNFVSRLLKGDRCILKLHGDAANHQTYVFTEAQYKESYGEPLDFKKPLPKALRQIFISHSLLFLGCSLEQDRTLDLFKEICNEEKFDIPDHFAVMPLPKDPVAKKAKESRLLRMGIRALWYPPDNNHEMVEKYLALVAEVAEGRITAF